MWWVNATDSQVSALQKLDGLREIEENVVHGGFEAVVPSQAQTTASSSEYVFSQQSPNAFPRMEVLI